MDQLAIKQIQHGFADAVSEAQKSLNHATTSKTPLTLVPEGFKIQELDLEKYEPTRRRFRGNMQTTSLIDFCNYSLENKMGGTTCFINAEEMSAKTIIDHGGRSEPGHCEDTAYVKLKKTAEYNAIQSISSRKIDQKTLAEFIEEWADHITCLDAHSLAIDCKKAINSIRKITIEANASSESETQSFRETRSSLESIEAKNDESRPHYINFKCYPYSDLRARDFMCRLSIFTGEQKPLLSLRIIREETHTEELSEEFKTVLATSFEGEIPTYLARFSI